MKFNENLKYLRKKEGLTQEELAEKLNVSRQSVTKWESGQSLPDIEKVKEISYLFSVSVDCLIGDVESKTTSKIKKKIDDIGWYIFGIVALSIVVIMSISSFLSNVFQNEDITITATIVMVIISGITLIAMLKKYLKNNTEVILNMKDNKEAKRERLRYIAKKYIVGIIIWSILVFILNMDLLPAEKKQFFIEFILEFFVGVVLNLLYIGYEYFKLEKTVKKLNKE